MDIFHVDMATSEGRGRKVCISVIGKKKWGMLLGTCMPHFIEVA